MLTLICGVVFEAVLLRFGRTDTGVRSLLWLSVVTGQSLVVWHTGVTWLTTIRRRNPVPARGAGRWQGSVDAFVTVCGEPLDVVRPVIQAVRDMEIPHDTWVLDDGASPELRELCRAENVGYLTRPTRVNGKAGNVNYALARTTGDLVAIFDADHRPDTTFLRKTVDHFTDDRLAFVQTPQSYVTRDTLVSRGAKQAQLPFYRAVMPGKARQGAAICVGTNVAFRRVALEQIGGLYEGSQSEDVHTSLRLHSLGWRSAYVPEVLAHGLPPENWQVYLRQQRRWARGAFEILFGGALWGRGRLGGAQRLQYSMLGTHYLSSLIFLLASCLPCLYLLSGVTPVSVHPLVLFSLALCSLVVIGLANRWENNSFGVAGAIAFMVASPACALGLIDALTRRHIDWAPTHGRSSPVRRTTSTSISTYRIATAGVCLVAAVVGLAGGLARQGHIDLAVLLGLPAAHNTWVFVPTAWCLIAALVFLLPSIRRLPRVRMSTPVRRTTVVATCAAVLVAATIIHPYGSAPSSSATRPTAPEWWREDFSGPAGTQPSERDWSFQTGHHYPGGPPNWGTGESQEYVRSSRNVRLDGHGHLEIVATTDGNHGYQSARIETRRSDFIPPLGGTLRIEARAKLPAARGSWATFWALGSSFRRDLRWPESGELDAIEYRGARPDEVTGVAHCPGCGEPVGKRAQYRDQRGLADEFHTYTMDWRSQPDRIDWYVDGKLYHSVTRKMLGEKSWVFDQPVFLLLNLAVGGDWPGPPQETDYPATMVVDYVAARTCLGQCSSPG
ncbi:hypothetical protein GCM10010302_42850 [Streptomyces polychromogenes]|uniref:GH16 domain-containing protein n=1 Tax=Streptomyces polychromogenes TaxID=67342 RepID=A0ABN0VHH3_9ACTN